MAPSEKDGTPLLEGRENMEDSSLLDPENLTTKTPKASYPRALILILYVSNLLLLLVVIVLSKRLSSQSQLESRRDPSLGVWCKSPSSTPCFLPNLIS